MTVSPTAGEAAELPLEVLALPVACIKHVMWEFQQRWRESISKMTVSSRAGGAGPEDGQHSGSRVERSVRPEQQP